MNVLYSADQKGRPLVPKPQWLGCSTYVLRIIHACCRRIYEDFCLDLFPTFLIWRRELASFCISIPRSLVESFFIYFILHVSWKVYCVFNELSMLFVVNIQHLKLHGQFEIRVCYKCLITSWQRRYNQLYQSNLTDRKAGQWSSEPQARGILPFLPFPFCNSASHFLVSTTGDSTYGLYNRSTCNI